VMEIGDEGRARLVEVIRGLLQSRASSLHESS